ncbi:PREDICTED: coiled-coil domain-containing protein 192 [Capra hircus]|uniref:coiled-coil domain-containing protein 192 n=1 Tax=Capra hircus TaxID=9925 RepID=UPI0008476F17|nr:PREDICTED: coiled-coil domain-containing protein 192 [Capra hircus]
MVFTLARLETLEICLKEAEEKAKVLSEQLAVSEGTKSKLLEQVSWLEKKLEALDCREDSGEPYKKMVLAKDQCIEKLQAEVKASQEQLAAHNCFMVANFINIFWSLQRRKHKLPPTVVLQICATALQFLKHLFIFNIIARNQKEETGRNKRNCWRRS